MSPFVQVAWAAGGGTPGNVTVRTAANGDSYYAQVTNTYGDASKAYMPYSTEDARAFVRFQLNVPKDATITLAQFTWYSSYFPNFTLNTPADDITVACEQVDSAAQVTDRSTLLTRYGDAGATTVTWTTNGVTFDQFDTNTSDDLKTIVQQIVNRAGWAANNYIGFFLDHGGGGTSDTTQWYLHAGGASTSRHPQLYVEYTA